jgi:membrane protein
MAGIGALKDRALGVVRTQREKRPWLDHLIRAYRRYKSTRGDHMAAAITYFSFLAIFPLLLLGISVTGFVLANNPALVGDLKGLIAENVPGGLGTQLSDSVDSLIQHRNSIGIVALLGVAYSGLGWIGNLRTGLQVVWSCEPQEENFVKAKLGDLVVLLGLGLGIVLSLALTSGGTAAAHWLVTSVGLGDVPGMTVLLRIVGIALALAADVLIFAFLFVRLPRRKVRYRTVLRGALFAAVGYEILKVVGTYYIARVGSSPTYGALAGVVGLLVWIDLVSRFLLLSAAWTATGQQPAEAVDCADDTPEPGPAVGTAVGTEEKPAGADAVVGPAPAAGVRARRDPPRPAAVAGVLVGAGAAVGATAATAGRRYLRRKPKSPPDRQAAAEQTRILIHDDSPAVRRQGTAVRDRR